MSDASKGLMEMDDKVITPGGPRARSMVRRVAPGEVLSFDASGTASIMPPSRATDFVLTPGGYRPRSIVHKVEPGHVLRAVEGGNVRPFDVARGAMLDQPTAVVRAADIPALGSGWIAYAFWENTTGSPLVSFRTTWTVPPTPASTSSQTIFLFNGTENQAGTSILQPVLQWGSSAAGGGPYWAVASWFVAPDGHAYFSNLVPVDPGQALVGVMTLTGQSGATFSYHGEFEGIANTGLDMQNIDELVLYAQTLEAYAIQSCSDYPGADMTAFTGIDLQLGIGAPALDWSPTSMVTDCGQHAVVVSNSPTEGEVDIFYR